MAHESFEDDATARVMNGLYVNIKVDREERPDIDKVYQVAHQLLTQRGGGWPLTMFLDPETRHPFFGGTYFPKDARYGLPAFSDLLERVAVYYREQPAEVREHGGRIAAYMERLDAAPRAGAADLTDEPLAAARKTLTQVFDREFGGFGQAPKFPHPTNIHFLLRQWRGSAHDEHPDLDALHMTTLTLVRMADGGIFDHLGGGFCRYSVDRYWQIPHFEKMLYDNGPLLALYAQAYLATGDESYATVARRIADWLATDMLASNGGFFSTRDADSEGEEGRYYVWTPDEVRALLGPAEFDAVAGRFGLDDTPNFEGRWHLAVRRSVADIAANLGRGETEIADAIAAGTRQLLAVRARRVPPLRDEKQLTAWNALAIRGFAIAGRALGDESLIDVATGAAVFLHTTLYRDGRLLAVHKDGRARFPAYLDDHAFLLDALLELLQARWSADRLAFAIQVADLLLEHFEDVAGGGFWFTADDAERLMHRPKPLADEALPSGNGVAAFALQRLGFLLGERRYLDAAARALRFAWPALTEFPHAHMTLLDALDEHLRPPEIVILRGPAPEIARWSRSAAQIFAPRRLFLPIPEEEKGLPGALSERKARPGTVLAYRCNGTECDLPVTSWEVLAAQMTGK
jgi:uncharacterized protein YyaL (SSP411 family)